VRSSARSLFRIGRRLSIAGAASADSPIASVVPNGASVRSVGAPSLACGFDTDGGSRTAAAQPADCVRFLFDRTVPQGISLTKCCGFASRVPTAFALAWLKLYRTLLGKPGMVALAEQNVASKTPRNGISGLTLEPVRNVHGVETLVLGPGQSLIGSSSDCSHILRANGVQPRHCEIRIDAGRATLRALDFRTWLNNGPVRQVELHVGDRLTVGPLEFRISGPASERDDSAAPVSAPQPAAVPVPVAPAIPDYVTATQLRQKEAEARLAETESRLLQQADEIQSRLRSLEY
jgi:hypothetical protein